MQNIIIVAEGHDDLAAGRMSCVDYVRGRGRHLSAMTRILFEESVTRPARLRYDAAMIAIARGHRSFPTVLDLVDGLAPRIQDCSHVARAQDWERLPNREPLVGILHDPLDGLAPSTPASLEDMQREFARHSIRTLICDPRKNHSLDPMDALFVRTHTSPGNTAWRWAMEARHSDIPVIDDPDSIIRCCNKLFMMESFSRSGIPSPRSCFVTCEGDLEDVIRQLGLPLILKTPDGSFSKGVWKADNTEDAIRILGAHEKKYPILLAQEFVPTSFDWRIGVLDGRPLFACRYFMANGHWQIFKTENDGGVLEGRGEAVAVHQAPRDIVATAIRAANCMGRGLYGVDLKVVNGRPLVIEVNDNPTIESDLEASIDPVWSLLAEYFLAKINGHEPPALSDVRASA